MNKKRPTEQWTNNPYLPQEQRFQEKEFQAISGGDTWIGEIDP